jgi:hypothetical protein
MPRRTYSYNFQMRVDERWYNIVDDSLKEQGYGPRDISRFVRDAVIAKATN